jgi:hypothetical protein
MEPGPLYTVSLAEAPAKALSFRPCAEAYIAEHKAGWRNSNHAAQWPSTLAMYVLRDLRCAPGASRRRRARHDGDRTDLDGQARDGRPGAGRIESILDWASTRGYRQVRTRHVGAGISKTCC